jgi:hypothetical protein
MEMKRIGLVGLLLCVGIIISKVFAHPELNTFMLVAAHTTGDTFSYAHSGRLVTNPAATGSLTFNLPPAAPGLHFIFALSAAQRIVVNPEDGDLFIGTGITPVPGAGDAIQSDQIVGTLIEIVAIDSTNWLQIRKVGTWADP